MSRAMFNNYKEILHKFNAILPISIKVNCLIIVETQPIRDTVNILCLPLGFDIAKRCVILKMSNLIDKDMFL